MCVKSCPLQTYAYSDSTVKLCLDICPSTYFGDTTLGYGICL